MQHGNPNIRGRKTFCQAKMEFVEYYNFAVDRYEMEHVLVLSNK